jgi:amino acid adenylation domain-containing protein
MSQSNTPDWLSKRLEKAREKLSSGSTITPRPNPGLVPLSFTQERFWILDQFNPGDPVYNRPILLRLRGDLEIGALQNSLGEIIRRHDSLRAVFPTEDGGPQQIIQPHFELPINLSELEEPPSNTISEAAQLWVKQQLNQPLDMGTGPLLKMDLLRLGPKEHLILLVAQHILFDAWSARRFIRELFQGYDACIEKRPSPFPDLPIQYADYAHWQRTQFEKGAMEKDLAYWMTRLADAPPHLNLPLDYSRPKSMNYRGAMRSHTLPAQLVSDLRAFSKKENVTLFMTLLAAFKVVLHRYSGQTDLVVGSPVAGRSHVELESLIGVLFNTLPLRTDLSGDPTFPTLLKRVRQTALEAYAHQSLPFEKMVEHLNPPREANRSSIFQVMFNLENLTEALPTSRYLTIEEIEFDHQVAFYELSVEFVETSEGLTGLFHYKTDLFAAATIERMISHFETLLSAVTDSPNQSISRLPMLGEAERHQILVEWNDTASPVSNDRCIHRLFEEQVERTPEAAALIFEDSELSYHDLNQRANQLAHRLLEMGVVADSIVGVCVERSFEMFIGLFGVLKAGGAYLPMDPAYPKERLSYMLEDSQTSILLTQSHLVCGLPAFQGRIICLDKTGSETKQQPVTNPNGRCDPKHLAYVIYTSGSTGTPKGVMIEHQALVNFTAGVTKQYGITGNDRILQFSSFSFDASVEEIFPALTTGASLVLRSETFLQTSKSFWQQCGYFRLTVLDLPTAFWHELVRDLGETAGQLPDSIRLVVIGGESVRAEAVNQWMEWAPPTIRLINGYGPTETTVVATTYEFAAKHQFEQVPIGRPLPNTLVYLLDPAGSPVPIGLPGELTIAGTGLARGYLNQPDLTAETFLPDPFAKHPGGRLYKTGDLAKYLPDGNIVFLGRMDHQVKIRGFRIEPGEIESVLATHPAVESCAVVARENSHGEKFLVAYVVTLPNSTPSPDFKIHLAESLPDYMIPAAFVEVIELPLSPNGKLDIQALPIPAPSEEAATAFEAPRGPIEKRMASIWEEILEINPISRDADFFALGGHSLMAMRICSRLQSGFNVSLRIDKIFDYPTIRELAPMIEKLLKES